MQQQSQSYGQPGRLPDQHDGPKWQQREYAPGNTDSAESNEGDRRILTSNDELARHVTCTRFSGRAAADQTRCLHRVVGSTWPTSRLETSASRRVRNRRSLALVTSS